MTRPALRTALAWGGLLAAIAVPLALAANSPLLAWRQPVYIAAGFAGVAAMGLLLLQPLLAAGLLPGLGPLQGRRAHRWIGGTLVLAIAGHVAGLWLTSPPDVIDALTFTSPTPFSAWGVIAMWALFATACLAFLRRRWRLRPAVWRAAHLSLALVIALCSVVHALLIEGTMEPISKVVLCGLVLLATGLIVLDRLRSGKRRATAAAARRPG